MSTTTTDTAQFIGVLFGPGDIIELRAIWPVRDGHAPQSKWIKSADIEAAMAWMTSANNEGFGIYAGVHPRTKVGGSKAADVVYARCLFADFDGTSVDDATARINSSGLPAPSMTISSGHGAHGYWLLAERVTDFALWSETQKNLAAMLGSDGVVHDAPRIMRIPGFVNTKSPAAPCEMVDCDPQRRYSLADLQALIPHRPTPSNGKARANANGKTVGEGGRNAHLTSLAGSMRNRGMTQTAIEAALLAENVASCVPPLDNSEVADIAASVARYAPHTKQTSKIQLDDDGWPVAPFILRNPEPKRLAEHFIDSHFRDGTGRLLLRRWAQEFYRYLKAGYRTLTTESIDADLWNHIDGLYTPEIDAKSGLPTGEVKKVRLTKAVVADVRAALISCHVLIDAEPPTWIDGEEHDVDPRNLLSFTNGLIDASAAKPKLLSPTPELFTLSPLDYAFDANAPEPVEWLKFLHSLWPDDPQSRDCLGEWFGYCLTQHTGQQKALMLVGPKRSGKGTIARILRRLIGEANVCAPTLAGLSTNFGLWPLIGKSLAIIGDARLSGRTDQACVTERILSITGEDALTIDRKNREPITLKLATRIMLLSNELPKLSDASGALASRFIILSMTKSFFGCEDQGIFDRVSAELPGILQWALAGWRRLQARGHFVAPDSAIERMAEMMELSAPISTFIADNCVVDSSETPAPDLFTSWQIWCAENGREHPGDVQTFGRDLRAALPSIGMRVHRDEFGKRVRHYVGVRLSAAAAESVNLRYSSKNGGER